MEKRVHLLEGVDGPANRRTFQKLDGYLKFLGPARGFFIMFQKVLQIQRQPLKREARRRRTEAQRSQVTFLHSRQARRVQTQNHPAVRRAGLSLGLAQGGQRTRFTQRTKTRRSVPARVNDRACCWELGVAWYPSGSSEGVWGHR